MLKNKKVFLKISGEFLGNPSEMPNINEALKIINHLQENNCKIGIMIGGGNIIRGKSSLKINQVIKDQMGMLGTIINSLAIKSQIQNSKCVSSIDVSGICEKYFYQKDIDEFNNGKILIFAGGIGLSHFSTDTASVLRAVEMECDIMIKMTKLQGIFDSDPIINPEAKFLKNISYEEVIQKNLNFMDITSITLAKENNLPILVFSTNYSKIEDIVDGNGIFSLIS